VIHLYHTVMEAAALIIDAAASAVMVWGFLVGIYAFLKASSVGEATDRMMRLQVVRCDLGVKLVFALELLIISDLLHTVVSRSLEDLWFLAALVLIRTTVGFFLNREIQEIGAQMQR
jgi:uncharacterized membrane protein